MYHLCHFSQSQKTRTSLFPKLLPSRSHALQLLCGPDLKVRVRVRVSCHGVGGAGEQCYNKVFLM